MRWILLTVLAALGAIACSGSLMTGIRARSWIETKARIIRCEVDQLEELAVIYEYTAGGQKYFGTRFGFMEGKPQRNWATVYKPGLDVTCFVNPNDPGEALLRRDLALTHWLWPGIFVVAASGLAHGARRALVQQRIADAATLYTLETAVTGRPRGKRRAA